MTTTTTNFESIDVARLDAVQGGCKKGGCPAPQRQAMMGPPPGGGGDGGPVEVAVDYNATAAGAQAQTQTA